jgi:ABC-type multidrug transport system fused ATPase/permease subunit
MNMFSKMMEYPKYFYNVLKVRLIIVGLIMIIISFLDAIGLTMLLPLLKATDDKIISQRSDFGNLDYVFDFINNFGFELNLFTLLGFFCGFFILKSIVVLFGSIYRVKTQQYFIKKLRVDMLHGLSSLKYKKFIRSNVGRIQNTMSGEVSKVSLALSAWITSLQHLIFLLVYVIFATILNPEFTIFVIVGGFIINLVFKIIFKITKNVSILITEENHQYQGLLIQFISGFKYLKATGTIGIINLKLIENIKRLEKNNIKLGILSSIAKSIREPALIIIISLGIIFQMLYMEMIFSGIMVSLLFFYRALNSLSAMQNRWNAFLGNSGSLNNMRIFRKELNENIEHNGSSEYEGFFKLIKFENINFSYGQENIIKNFNFNIEKNETVALVGESGSGKTTIVNLLSGLMPVNDGEILIDGRNINSFNRLNYQKKIGYITQEPTIFDANIFNNITLWDEPNELNVKKYINAIKKASIYDFIMERPLKENTILGNNGINLSGGQKQRISIAREIYKDIDILIMDEATSALDTETEKSIRENIDNLKGHFTIVIVAHRLSTIKNANKILILKNGAILNSGSYKYLIANEKTFKRMVKLQELK